MGMASINFKKCKHFKSDPPPPTKKIKPLKTNFKKYLISNLIKMGGKLNINNFKKKLTPNPK